MLLIDSQKRFSCLYPFIVIQGMSYEVLMGIQALTQGI